MQRAKLLLKASKTMIGDSTRISMNIFRSIAYVMSIIAIIGVVIGIILEKNNIAGETALWGLSIKLAFMVIGYGMAVNAYTGFMEQRKEATKSNFKAFSLQLPVTKEDFIKAQFIDSLRNALPGILLIIYMIILHELIRKSPIGSVCIGMGTLFFISTFLIVTVERSLFISYFIDYKIRMIVYSGIALLSALVCMIPKEVTNDFIKNIEIIMNGSNRGSMYYWVRGLQFLGSLWGVLIISMTILLGYYLSIKLPLKIHHLKEGRK